jgi:formyltetrahydrofolate deformylase
MALADQFGAAWRNIGDHKGNPDDERMLAICDEFDLDCVILAGYMRVLLPAVCCKYADGWLIYLHHGLLPSFPGFRPYTGDGQDFRVVQKAIKNGRGAGNVRK